MVPESFVLLTSLGTNRPRGPVTYHHGEQAASARFSAIGLWKLLPQSARPSRAVVLATQEAVETNGEFFRKEASDNGLWAEVYEVAGGSTGEEVAAFLTEAGRSIPERSRVVLDLTQGLRHHAFLFYSLALYLTSLRGVEISGAWYGRLWGDLKGEFVDMRPVLELAEWFHAVRVFREQGATAPIAGMMEKLHKELLGQQGDHVEIMQRLSPVQRAGEQLREMSFAYELGLPLELGSRAYNVSTMLDDALLDVVGTAVPAFRDLMSQIRDQAQSMALTTRRRGEWKSSVALDRNELRRQLHLIKQYLTRGQTLPAAGLMREWLITWMMQSVSDVRTWLARKDREIAEKRLGWLAQQARKGPKPSDELSLRCGQVWGRITQIRNGFHHHGMQPQEVKDQTKELEEIRQALCWLVDEDPPHVAEAEDTLPSGSGHCYPDAP